MIPLASSVRIWIATGHTDMRKGMQGLALLVQEGLGRDPFAGDVYVFRGRNGSLIKAIWHDGIGLSLPARLTPELAATLQTKNITTEVSSACSITWITYAGDEAGIVCRLDFARGIET